MKEPSAKRPIRVRVKLYDRMRVLAAQMKKDGVKLYIHTTNDEIKPSLEGLFDYAGEWLLDCYIPIKTTPSARLEEFQTKTCPKCGREMRAKPKPHLDWGPLK